MVCAAILISFFLFSGEVLPLLLVRVRPGLSRGGAGGATAIFPGDNGSTSTVR